MKTEYLLECYERTRVDKEEKTILPIVGISFQSKVILPQEVLINYSSR